MYISKDMVVYTVTNVFYLILFISEFKVANMSLPCSGCGPGFFCSTDDVRTGCLACEDGYYKPGYNAATFCNPCKTFCPGNTLLEEREFLSKNCTKTDNSVCSCKHGFYRQQNINGLCLKWTTCDVGFGVTIPGTDINDVVCEPCKEGFTSDKISSTEQCLKKQTIGFPSWAIVCSAIVIMGLIVAVSICSFWKRKRNRGDSKDDIGINDN